MKLLYSTFTLLCLLPAFSILAQDDSTQKNTKTDHYDIFSKGINQFTLMRNFDLKFSNVYNNDVKENHTNDEALNVEWTKYITHGFGIGLQLNGDWSGVHYENNSDQL